MAKYSIKYSGDPLFSGLLHTMEDKFKTAAQKIIPNIYYATVDAGSKTWILFSEYYKTVKELKAHARYNIKSSYGTHKISDDLIDWLGDEIMKSKSNFVGEIE